MTDLDMTQLTMYGFRVHTPATVPSDPRLYIVLYDTPFTITEAGACQFIMQIGAGTSHIAG